MELRVVSVSVLSIVALLFAAPASAEVVLSTDQSCYQPGEEIVVTIFNGIGQQISVGDGIQVETQEGAQVWMPVCTNDGIFVLEPGENFQIETTWDQTDRGDWVISGCDWVDAQQVPDGCYRVVKGYFGSPGGAVVADFGIGDCPCPADVASSTLEGPTEVLALASGAFGYETSFTAGGGGVGFGFGSIFGGANTDLPAVEIDGECIEPIDEGTQWVESVSGSLIDPTQAGSATVRYVLCSGEELIVETTILPAGIPVPTLSQWGMALMAFGLLAAGAILFRRLL